MKRSRSGRIFSEALHRRDNIGRFTTGTAIRSASNKGFYRDVRKSKRMTSGKQVDQITALHNYLKKI